MYISPPICNQLLPRLSSEMHLHFQSINRFPRSIFVSSGQAKQITRAQQSMQLVSQRCEVFQAGSGVADVIDAPFRDQGRFLPSRVHRQAGTLPHQPRVMLSEPRCVGVFAGCNESHLVLIDQVVEQLGEELGEPPHAHQISATRVVGPLPATLLALIALLLVILAVELDDLPSDFFVNHAIQGQTFVFLELGDHEGLVLFHDCRLFGHVREGYGHERSHSLEQKHDHV